MTTKLDYLEIFNRADPTLRSAEEKPDDSIFIIPTQEMKAWRNIQTTVCSFCGKLQMRKLLCGKVRLIGVYLLC